MPSWSVRSLGFGANISVNTLHQMARIIRESSINPSIISVARKIVAEVPWKQEYPEVEAVYTFMQRYCRYVKDPVGQETITTPPLALAQIRDVGLFHGDCDDFTVLSLSLLRSIGYPVAMRIASYHDSKVPEHVYGLVQMSDGWKPFDAIKIDGYFPWENASATYVKDYRID
jgi:transglutaminase-like putative cysteine protease